MKDLPFTAAKYNPGETQPCAILTYLPEGGIIETPLRSGRGYPVVKTC